MRPYILAETNWYTTKDQEYELAVLPWGATEAHNYHIPYGADIIEADKISAEAARIAWEQGARVIVLPTIPYGVNTGQKDIKLDINMNPSTQLAVLEDVVRVLNHQKIRKLLILNSHGGNDFKPMIRELGVTYPEVYMCTANWYTALNIKDYFEEEGEHGGEMETSLLLYLTPSLVLPLDKASDGKEKKHKIETFREGWAWAERKWPEVTKDTGIGNPKKATAEKGKKYFNDLCEKVARLMVDLADLDPEDMYE